MAELKDYYQILGVARGATEDEIKRAYRRLAKQYHPDINKSKGAEDRFKEVSEAYNTLSEPEKRKQYDMLGQAYERGFRGFKWEGGPTGGFEFEGNGPQGFGGFGNLGDMFSELFEMGGIRTGAGRPGGRRSSGQRAEAQPAPGMDLYTDVTIDFLEAIAGTDRKIAISRGNQNEELKIKIPAGVDNGSKVRVAGKGQPGSGGGPAGDLYLRIRVNPHPIFWRENADIYCEVPIAIYEATLGAAITVPTLDGTAQMKVPKGTMSGQKFRLKAKGAPVLGKKNTTGDQYVVVQIVPPKDLNKETETLMRQWAEKHPYNPREA